MRMSNGHERRIAAPTARVGTLLDTLASSHDRFWPHENWPAIRFDWLQQTMKRWNEMPSG